MGSERQSKGLNLGAWLQGVTHQVPQPYLGFRPPWDSVLHAMRTGGGRALGFQHEDLKMPVPTPTWFLSASVGAGAGAPHRTAP